MKTTNNIPMKISQYIKTFIGIGLITIIIGLFGAVFLYATTANVGPSGEDKNGKFYEYFSNITTSPDVSITNPYFTGFGTGFKSEYSDGNTFVKSYLATLSGSSTYIVTGFDGSGEIQRTSIEVFMRAWLGSFGVNPTLNSAIIGFSNTTGYPIYSREVGYWTSISNGINYTGGVQIGESVVPGSLEVVGGNITVNNIVPSNDDDLVTKSYIDSYLRDTCVRFLGTWDASIGKCSKTGGGGGGGSCTPGTWGTCTGACGTNNGTQSRTDSCGNTTTQSCTASTCTSTPTCDDGIRNQGETQVDCGGPNCDSCTVTPPSCYDGVQNQGETGVDCGGPNCGTCGITTEPVTCGTALGTCSDGSTQPYNKTCGNGSVMWGCGNNLCFGRQIACECVPDGSCDIGKSPICGKPNMGSNSCGGICFADGPKCGDSTMINGKCNNGVSNSCISGTPFAFTKGDINKCGTYDTWACAGSNGGTDVLFCGAPAGPICQVIDGKCGSIPGTCDSPKPATADNGETACGTTRSWWCDPTDESGANRGKNVNCIVKNPACAIPVTTRASCTISKCVDFGNDIGTCGGGTPNEGLCDCYRYQDVTIADGTSIEVAETNLFAGTVSCKGYVWDFGWACEKRYSTVTCDNGTPIYN